MTHWKLNVCALLLMGILIRLGFWQIERAHEKQHMVHAAAQSAKNGVMAWSPVHPMPAQYQTIRLKGVFLPQVLLLDNQHHHHQFGYHVLSPFKPFPVQADVTRSERQEPLLLIDRGWIAGDRTRRALPDVPAPKGMLNLSAQVYYPSDKQLILGPEIEVKNQSLAVIETINPDKAGQFLKQPVYPFVLRLDGGQTGAMICEWPVVSMPPERHFGYAVQWFGLACVCCIFTIVMNVKRARKKIDSN